MLDFRASCPDLKLLQDWTQDTGLRWGTTKGLVGARPRVLKPQDFEVGTKIRGVVDLVGAGRKLAGSHMAGEYG